MRRLLSLSAPKAVVYKSIDSSYIFNDGPKWRQAPLLYFATIIAAFNIRAHRRHIALLHLDMEIDYLYNPAFVDKYGRNRRSSAAGGELKYIEGAENFLLARSDC
jgi:hypothetical protein